MMNYGQFLSRHWQENANKTLLIDSFSDQEYTYGDILTSTAGVLSYFKSRGIGRGDKIAILLDNSVEVAKLYFACLLGGVIVVPVNPILGEDQAAFIINNSGSKLLIQSNALTLSREILGAEIFIEQMNEEDSPLLRGMNDPHGAIDPDLFTSFREEDVMTIVYTSGTTANPKGVVHTYKNIIDNGLAFIEALSISSESRFINILPMTYLGGYYNLLMIPFLAGGSVVIAPAFNAKTALNFWEPVIRHEVNTLWVVPTIISILLELDRGSKGTDYCRNTNILGLVGTAPLSKSVKERFENKYGIQLNENYALSETFFLTTNRPGDEKRDNVGKLIPNVKMKIVDKHFRELPVGEEGEIAVQTFSLMKGYYNGTIQDVRELLVDGWFLTGDIGLITPTGELVVTSRKKDVIIKGGINISPAAIEEVILSHAAVRECAVVGIPEETMGEEVVCVVRVSPGSDFDQVRKELIQLTQSKLSSIHRPSHFLELAYFPYSSSGKIQKVKIRAWAIEETRKVKENRTSPAKKTITEDKNPSKFYRHSHIANSSIQATSIKYNNLMYDMKREGIDVTTLSLGEAFFDIPLFSFDHLPFPDLYHYTHSRGIIELRRKLAEYFEDEYDISFNADDEILITAGSKIAIHMALMTVVNPGDEVIILEPAWVSYPEQVKLCHGKPVMVPYYKSVYDLEEYITNRAKVIIINNPNNPSGKVYSVEELTFLVKLAEKYGLFILSDEAYSDFLLEGEQFVSIANIDKEKNHSIICNSMSKNYGMSGWRIGYVISNKETINQMLKLNQHMITCPASILQFYLAAYFNDIIRITKPQIKDVVKKRQRIAEYLDQIGLRYLEGTATFYLFVSIEGTKLSSDEFCMKLLTEKHICVVPGLGYGNSCDQFIRVSIGTESDERIFRGLDEIKALINNTK